VATPPEFPKGIPGIWSPEHLFTASRKQLPDDDIPGHCGKFKIGYLFDFQCSAKGKLENVDGQWIMSEILLEPLVVISNEDLMEKALRILTKRKRPA
jgi:hypothetical protein